MRVQEMLFVDCCVRRKPSRTRRAAQAFLGGMDLGDPGPVLEKTRREARALGERLPAGAQALERPPAAVHSQGPRICRMAL